jgi:hypothetical protein
MTDKEVDRLWGVAMHESIKAGEMFTRYRFAALVADTERERCAQVCEDHHMSDGDWCAKQIRASA